MKPSEQILKILKNDWTIALLLLILFLATNGYTLGWDDQHLEIPLLKSLIEPGLYVGDYYIESLKRNFPSLLYPLLARVITINQIPAVYFFLFLLSRFFMFWGMFKIWQIITRGRLAALISTVTIIILGRVEEFLYRTFSHQELALAAIFAAIYFGYKERFILAGIVFGLAANFHALYSFFPFLYLCVYLVWQIRRHGAKSLLKTVLAFAIFSSPILIWSIRHHAMSFFAGDGTSHQNWLQLYLVACPQNFLFINIPLRIILKNATAFFQAIMPYGILGVFYLLNLIYHPEFRKDTKTQAAIGTGFGLIIFSFVFSYLIPVRFILDLNLVRNIQFILFYLMGYTAWLLWKETRLAPAWGAFGLVLTFSFIRFGNDTFLLSGAALIFLLGLLRWKAKGKFLRKITAGFFILGLLSSLGGIAYQFFIHQYSPIIKVTLSVIFLLLLMLCLGQYLFPAKAGRLRVFFLIIPLLGYTANFIFYHYRHLKMEKTSSGFWQLQRNWIDMQKYCRDHTARDALFLIPNDMEMGGFRIFSERKVICDYRDCGIIGFDYAAAVEWQRRLKDIASFKVIADGPVTQALANAIFKYKANYIIFMGYLNPGPNPYLSPLYKNETFALYKVLINP